MLNELLDVILPRECVVCGERLDRCERHICLHCLAGLPLTYTWDMAHNRISDKFNETVQRDISSYEPYIFASSLFFYNGEADYRKILYSLKYHGNMSLGRMFGNMLGKKIGKAGHFADINLVIPVPLHWTRKWKRGYNQAETIAAAVARQLNADLETGLLYRKRRTKTQTRLNVVQKAANVADAFAVREKRAGKILHDTGHILLVDDVFTTGATLKACYLALRRHFPASVRISVATLGFVGD